jgi:hypothetical protein
MNTVSPSDVEVKANTRSLPHAASDEREWRAASGEWRVTPHHHVSPKPCEAPDGSRDCTRETCRAELKMTGAP